MLKWKVALDGDQDEVAFVEDLRRLAERGAQRNDLTTLLQVAETAHLTPSVLSDAVNGRRLPTITTLNALLALVEADADEQTAWRDRLKGLLMPPEPTDTLPTRLGVRARAWDAVPDTEEDYHDPTRLGTEQELLEALGPARERQLSGADDVLWAWLVTSAVQHGASYRQWFELSGPRNSVIESLVERVIGGHRRPALRAAWLLQWAPAALRQAATALARELAGGEDEMDSGLKDLLSATDHMQVDRFVAERADLTTDVRMALKREFAVQRGGRSAKGRLQQFLPAVDPRDQILLGERLKTYRDLAFVAVRVQADLETGVAGDQGVDSTWEGLSLRASDVRRLGQPEISAVVENLVEHLRDWHARLADADPSLDPAEMGLETDRLLRQIDALAADSLYA